MPNTSTQWRLPSWFHFLYILFSTAYLIFIFLISFLLLSMLASFFALFFSSVCSKISFPSSPFRSPHIRSFLLPVLLIRLAGVRLVKSIRALINKNYGPTAAGHSLRGSRRGCVYMRGSPYVLLFLSKIFLETILLGFSTFDCFISLVCCYVLCNVWISCTNILGYFNSREW